MLVILTILAISLIISGILGLIYPAVPGLPLMFIGAWLLADVGDYTVIGTWTLVILGIVTALGMILEFLAGILGAKYTGASKQAILYAFIGGIIGIFFALPGLILGPLIGATIGEFLSKQDLLQAGKVGIGTFIGFIFGIIAKLGCGLTILLTIIIQFSIHASNILI